MACKVYVWLQADVSESSIEKYIKEQDQETKVHFISSTNSSFPESGKHPTIVEYVVRLCRSHGILGNRVTLLSEEESLQALQLCLASRNKERGGKFDVDAAKVWEYHQKVRSSRLHQHDLSSSQNSSELSQQYEEFLMSCNQWDAVGVVAAFARELAKDLDESKLKRDLAETALVFCKMPRQETEKLLLKYLCDGKIIQIVEKTETSEILGESPFSTENKSMEELFPLVAETPMKGSNQKVTSVKQVFTRQILLSYLHILVNSRSELSLAKLFNIPNRDLDHHAFTALKHETKRKNMSMFQTATSFLMRIKLGGKGYAPDISCPLNQYIKGYGDLIDLVQKLQTIAEEDPDPRSAFRRILNNVKNRLARCQLVKISREDAEEATEKLLQCIMGIIDSFDKQATQSPNKPASEGGSLIGRKTLRVIRLLLDKMAAAEEEDNSSYLFLHDLALSPSTPSRVPCLLSQFRSPDASVEEPTPDKPKQQNLHDRTNLHNREVILPCGEKLTKRQLNSVIVLPSKTLACPAPETAKLMLGLQPSKKLVSCAVLDKENVFAHRFESDQPAKKRKITENVSKSTNETSSQQASSQNKKKSADKKGCRRRLLPQVKGQQKISGFFRV